MSWLDTLGIHKGIGLRHGDLSQTYLKQLVGSLQTKMLTETING